MGDAYGATTLPLVAASPQGTDPFTTYVLQYLQAVANAYAVDEWSSIAPGGSNPVASISDTDPELAGFNTKNLPALYLFRSEIADHVQVAQDIRIETGVMSLIWVPPPAAREGAQRVRSNFAVKLFKLLDDSIEQERDPAWVVSGDTYFNAQTLGSWLPKWALYRRFRLGAMKRRDVMIPITGDKTNREPFEAYACTCPYEEERTPDLSRYDLVDGADLTFESADEPPFVFHETTLD